MNMEERLQAVVSQVETDSTKWHNIIHGLDTESVATDNGNVPKVIKSNMWKPKTIDLKK